MLREETDAKLLRACLGHADVTVLPFTARKMSETAKVGDEQRPGRLIERDETLTGNTPPTSLSLFLLFVPRDMKAFGGARFFRTVSRKIRFVSIFSTLFSFVRDGRLGRRKLAPFRVAFFFIYRLFSRFCCFYLTPFFDVVMKRADFDQLIYA